MAEGRTTVLILMLLLAISGCHRGPARGAVHGEITLDGEPVDGGQIYFIPAGPKAVPAWAAIEGGRYQIAAANGPSVGKCRVEIYWAQKSGAKVANPMGVEVEDTVQVIPAIYNDKSQLEVEIKGGANQYKTELRSK